MSQGPVPFLYCDLNKRAIITNNTQFSVSSSQIKSYVTRIDLAGDLHRTQLVLVSLTCVCCPLLLSASLTSSAVLPNLSSSNFVDRHDCCSGRRRIIVDRRDSRRLHSQFRCHHVVDRSLPVAAWCLRYSSSSLFHIISYHKNITSATITKRPYVHYNSQFTTSFKLSCAACRWMIVKMI